MDHLGNLGVGNRALGPDGVEIALDELAEPALCGALASKNGANGVALEGLSQLVDVLGDEPGERDRQVEPESQLVGIAAFVGDRVNLAEDFVGARPFAGQDFHALDVRAFRSARTRSRQTSCGR